MAIKKQDGSVTISDVAKAAHTSVATVSRVLSGSNYPVSRESRENVLLAAKELGYSPNLLGKMLKTNRNPSIGIIISSFQNPFYNQIIMGIERAARKRGYYSPVYSSQRDPLSERALISGLVQNRIQGLMISSVDNSPEYLEKYLASGGKACVFESNYMNIGNVINAKSDMLEASEIAVEYLVSQGHKSIAFLTTPLSRQSRQFTLDGCRIALSKHNIQLADDDIFVVHDERELEDGLYEFEAGIMLAQELLQRNKKYTAIIANNDLIAYGIIQGLKQNRVKVPDDISVIGFDDIPYSSMMTPQLTTVHLHSRLLGEKACNFLIDSIESGEDISGMTISFRSGIIIRESVKSLLI
jgi:LacI family transcriptional regulator